MKHKILLLFALSVAALLVVGIVTAGNPMGTGFTYQGFLKYNGNPAEGAFDLEFKLFDAATDGTQIGSSVAHDDETVTNGLFVVPLDFGSAAFNGEERWLEIAVRPGVETGAYTTLTPRQALTPAPYSLYASTATSAGDADLLDGQHASAFQARVSGACAVGSTARAINADGTVDCWSDAPLNRAAAPASNISTTVDSAGSVGMYSSSTIGADGLPVVGYWDSGNHDLRVLHCGDLSCSSGNTVTTVDSADVGSGGTASIAIGADGLPVFSYWDFGNNDLKVLHCGNVLCNSGNTATTVDSAGETGYYPSITIGTDGLPVVAYLDNTNGDLKVLHCGNALCNSDNISTTVDSAGVVGEMSSITLGADGLLVVAYLDNTNDDLKVLHCGNALCDSGNISTTVDSAESVGQIALGADGLPVIIYLAYGNNALKVLHCGNALCNSGNISTTVDAGPVAAFPSITIGADGLPVVAYMDNTNSDLRVLHCGNPACDNGNTAITVDSAGVVGEFPSISLGADGLPVIGYWDRTNDDLKVLDCANTFCTPYFRRR